MAEGKLGCAVFGCMQVGVPGVPVGLGFASAICGVKLCVGHL